ncbi:MAG: NAD(P)/FAD-dependent oxidoreductase [Bacteroidetes bacterium]|nr:MAG: NAD(P)/FAD-dependent oxidoreductase [Bacteroidota bacterium]
MERVKTVIVIGGGAAGFFAAIACAEANPNLKVIILEKSSKLLAKVRVSGGGRCNVTHACFDPSDLVRNYPRGGRELLGPFHVFSPENTIEWFASRGVKLKIEADGRMFPTTDDSTTIVNCLMNAAQNALVNIRMNSPVHSIHKREDNLFELGLSDEEKMLCDAVIVASGGSPSLKGFDCLKGTGHTIIEPVPSLFTFNMPHNPITQLMGISVDPVQVKIIGTKFINEGPLLITHWGMSGPAILKLSSFAAPKLAELNYNFSILIKWLPQFTEDSMRSKLNELRKELAKKKVSTSNPFLLPKRLWEHLLNVSVTDVEKEWAQLNNEELRKLISVLIADEYNVQGKTTFKEEFVTCGGVSLKEVDFKTMQSKKAQGLFFAGEILDIDAVTGGFNFQSAWTTGFIAGKSLVYYLEHLSTL